VAVSDVSICNQAIGWVGGNLIISLTQDQAEARLCNANYAALRNAVLEAADWTFAMRRFAPAKLAAAPAWGYSSQFQLLADVLRVVYCGLSARAEEDDPVPSWVKEGRTILANADTIYVRGIVDVTDPAQFSPLFGQALAARIAMDLAIPIASSRSLQSDMASLFSSKMAEAVSQDNKQGRTRLLRAPGMRQARRAGAAGYIGPTV
jgi:hypothetical protein